MTYNLSFEGMQPRVKTRGFLLHGSSHSYRLSNCKVFSNWLVKSAGFAYNRICIAKDRL